MRDELLRKIMLALMEAGVDAEQVRSRLVIVLDQYEITQRCTEVAVVNENETEKYMRLFLVNKRVAGRTDRTIEHYRNELRRFFDSVQKSPLEITSDDIKLYLATKDVRDKISKVSQQNILRVLSTFYTWMIREEYITKNPMNKVDEIKVPKVKKEAFTEIQIEKIRFSAEGDIRKMCMIEMLLSTWCRISELVQIKLKEISEDMESVLIHGKGSKDRTCYINARARICLERYLKERHDSNEYLFPECRIKVSNTGEIFSVQCKKNSIKPKDWWMVPDMVGTGHADKGAVESIIRKTGKKAGVEKTHPHRFRRTGATFALRKGMPIEQVSKLLGHESIETTQIYLDISQNELEQAHRRYV